MRLNDDEDAKLDKSPVLSAKRSEQTAPPFKSSVLQDEKGIQDGIILSS